jgi:glycosyltransferase involved in cell wall biosynthesis
LPIQGTSTDNLRRGEDVTDLSELTVVVLTYNRAATIGDCLDSLVNQRYQDFEVIVVDDESEDETLSIVSGYSSRLRISVVRNGAHNIPRGRNIGLNSARTDFVAFLDSDDQAAPDWTQVIIDTFRKHPETTLIGGELRPGHRTAVGHAIALNDHAIRRLFLGGLLRFCAGNSAINLKLLQDTRFDEDFKFGEDLELASRITGPNAKHYVREMVVYQYSRETFPQYAKQMYRYGFVKVWVSFAAQSFRWLDFIPLALLVGGVGASLALQTWWPLLLNLPFALAEAIFVICYQRCPARIAVLTFPAWLVKNLSWSTGISCGLVTLAVNTNARRVVRSQRAVKTGAITVSVSGAHVMSGPEEGRG